MSRFVIEPHFRLQEWVAEEKDYFCDEALEYEFREFIRSTDGAHHKTAGKSGAFQSIERGRESNVTCACHWTVSVAASRGHTKLYADAYSVLRRRSSFRPPRQSGRLPTLRGCRSRSATSPAAITPPIQALEQYLPSDQIKLSFEEGMLFGRLELFLAGKSPAVALFNGPYYFAEQLGCRKIIDSTFMIGAMINGNPEADDIRKYFRALRRAQRDIDLRPDLYTHYYKNEFPERLHARMDTRCWGPGERIVFEPYSEEMFERSFDWIAKHAIFEPGGMGSGNYEQAVISLAAK